MLGLDDSELKAPIHEALTRDILIWGCERNAFLLAAVSAGFVAMAGFLDGKGWLTLVAVALFMAVVAPLQRMTREDPKAPLIWLRRLGNARVYDASPHYHCQSRRRAKTQFGDEE